MKDRIAVSGLVVAALTLVAAVLALWPIWADRNAHSLSATIVSSIRLDTEALTPMGDLKVLINKQQIAHPAFIVLELRNDGEKPITPADFADPLRITFGGDARLLRTSLAHTTPDNLAQHTRLALDGNTISLAPMLINSQESIQVAVTLDGTFPLNVSVDSRIAGVSGVPVNASADKAAETKYYGNWYALLVGTLGTLFTMAMMYLHARELSAAGHREGMTAFSLGLLGINLPMMGICLMAYENDIITDRQNSVWVAAICVSLAAAMYFSLKTPNGKSSP